MTAQKNLPPLGSVLHMDADAGIDTLRRGLIFGCVSDERSIRFVVVEQPDELRRTLADAGRRAELLAAFGGEETDERALLGYGIRLLGQNDIPETYREQWISEITGCVPVERHRLLRESEV